MDIGTVTVSPRAAQAAARLGLRAAGHQIPPGCEIVLTAGVPGYEPSSHIYAVQPTQVDPVIAALLPWGHDLEGGAA